MTDLGLTSRAPADNTADDTILPFEVAPLDLRGRVVRLGPALDDILSRHQYPPPVSKLLGEAIVLTVLLGASLKFDGRFILQTKTDGPVRMIVVDWRSPGLVRACAQFDDAAVGSSVTSVGELMGRGHLAMTIDQGPDMSRYQGLVALSGGSLEDAAHEYFMRSEQIPTKVRLAVAEELRASANGTHHPLACRRAAAPVLAKEEAERMRTRDFDPGDAPAGVQPHQVPEDDAWIEGQALVATVEDVELIDPAISSERLLYRLFHEHGVRVFRASDVKSKCSCSRDSVTNMLKSFSQDDRDHMVENGVISVTCEFCNSKYVFAPAEVGAVARE